MRDEELIYALCKVVKHDSLASSRIGHPSYDTRKKLGELISSRDQQIALAARIDEQKWFQEKYEDELRRTDGRATALGVSLDRIHSLEATLKQAQKENE